VDDGEGRAVSRWMKTQIQGGPRPTTGYERRMLPGKYIMPGSHADMIQVLDLDQDTSRSISCVMNNCTIKNIRTVEGIIQQNGTNPKFNFHIRTDCDQGMRKNVRETGR